MRMKFTFLLALLLPACSWVKSTPIPTTSADIDTQEVAVYAALFGFLYPDQPLVLMDQTETNPGGAESTPSTLEYVISEMTGISPDTAASFQVRNDETVPLKADMALNQEYTLLSEEDMRQIFSANQDGWAIFYDRYQGVPGITRLSRVGFNSSMDQALVYVGTQSHWLAGAGYYYLMEKVDGNWVVKQQVMTWIS